MVPTRTPSGGYLNRSVRRILYPVPGIDPDSIARSDPLAGPDGELDDGVRPPAPEAGPGLEAGNALDLALDQPERVDGKRDERHV